MSKSKYNVINPDEICSQYGADTFRIYEMFLGPIKENKPWNDQSINGVYSFIKKLWNLFYNKGYFFVEDSDTSTSLIELKLLHGLIKKIKEDMVLFSLNTSISSFMTTVNELSAIKCRKISILEPIVKLISPFIPHISEELWHYMGYKNSISFFSIPTYNDKYIIEEIIQFTIMYDGKFCFKMHFFSEKNEKYIYDKVINHPKIIQLSKNNTIIKVIVIPYLVMNFLFQKKKIMLY